MIAKIDIKGVSQGYFLLSRFNFSVIYLLFLVLLMGVQWAEKRAAALWRLTGLPVLTRNVLVRHLDLCLLSSLPIKLLIYLAFLLGGGECL